MQKNLGLRSVLVFLLAVAAIMVAPASSSRGGEDEGVQVIRVTEVSGQEANLDLGEPGDSLGDQFVFSNDLVRHGKKVGTDGGVGTVVRLESMVSATLQFVATAQLPKGQITVQGLVTFTEANEGEPFELAITGGTGRYKAAHGVLTVDEVSETETLLTFRIIR